MKPEPSRLAPLVTAYYEKFGRYVPESALRHLEHRSGSASSGGARRWCSARGNWLGSTPAGV